MCYTIISYNGRVVGKDVDMKNNVNNKNDIQKLMPWDTVALVAPKSSLSPANKIAREIVMPEVDFVIENVEDAEKFDFNLTLFVHSAMDKFLDVEYFDDNLKEKAKKKMTKEEELEYDEIFETKLPKMREAMMKMDFDELPNGLLDEHSKLVHRLNQLKPIVWIRPYVSMAIYQYGSFDGLPLGDIFRICGNNRQKFNVFLDLKINFVNLSVYAYEMIGAELRFANAPNSFNVHMELQRAANALVMSCRAVWDKIMGMM